MDNYKKAMGERLHSRRKSLHMTQEQLAERLDISIKHYSEAERGITGLSVENLIKVSEILGSSLDYLLKGITLDYPLPSRLIEIYKNCPDEKKENFMQLLEMIEQMTHNE